MSTDLEWNIMIQILISAGFSSTTRIQIFLFSREAILVPCLRLFFFLHFLFIITTKKINFIMLCSVYVIDYLEDFVLCSEPFSFPFILCLSIASYIYKEDFTSSSMGSMVITYPTSAGG